MRLLFTALACLISVNIFSQTIPTNKTRAVNYTGVVCTPTGDARFLLQQ